MSDNVLLVVHSVQVSGFRSLEPRVSDFGSVLIKTTSCLGSVHFSTLSRFGSGYKLMWFMFIQVNKFEYLSNQVHVTVQLHFGRLRPTQLWFGSTSQHRSALIRVSLGLSSSAGLGATWFNPGLFHPARKVREVYWKIYNSLYIGAQDALVAAYPVVEDEGDNVCSRPVCLPEEAVER
ncbi:putative splicing factor 3B subunit 1 [Helianthus annuus]|nr:putative splicing factor 3B subunit 1 [Helianthus annuus]